MFFLLADSHGPFPQAWRGLGLAIVKQIADAHGAHIDPGTSPEGGLRATVAFPLV